MDVNNINLQNIFEQNRRHVVPLFQRAYVWDCDNQWQPLWEDVCMIAEQRERGVAVRPHFLGAVVLEQMKTKTGVIETRQVIDGQQRLTTLQLLLAAIRDICGALGLDRDQGALQRLTHNDDPYIEKDEERLKVWPTNIDRDPFQRTMAARSADGVRSAFEAKTDAWNVGHLVPDAYLYFYRSVVAWLEEVPEDKRQERIKTLILSLRTGLHVVVIDLDDRDDAQIIFETLNARGTPLLPSDLVKNFLFRNAESAGENVTALHDKSWAYLDEPFWREDVKQGRLKRPMIDIFLQHFLTLKLQESVVVTQLFNSFRRFFDEAGTSAADHVRELSKYGRIFRRFTEFPKDTREGLFFHRLELLDIRTVYPALLQLFAELGGPDRAEDLRQILTDLESFLVRRAVCRLTTKNYNRFFLELLIYARKAGGLKPETIRAFLLSQTADSSRWPTDDEFRGAWIEQQMYRMMTRRHVRLILEALDLALYTEKTERVHIPETLTIEHVLPQTWATHWPLTNPDDRAVARRNRLLHTIGNLTLLTKKLNPSVSNSPWSKKRPEILKHTALNMNRYFQERSEWTEEAIEERSALLFDSAQKIWPHPLGSEGTAPSVSAGSETVEEEPTLARIRSNFEELVAEFSRDDVDVIAIFQQMYPEDIEELRRLYARQPRYDWRVFLAQELVRLRG